ncbi:hypothetical protein BO70DRAFT_373299 [Aspergillus heteromorphus CBS 117.55]|uniref:Protein kinase domain-containing protein n=1 Tax=Aspergillus heteromorphus CBS 117.55 TaxID=1448321 RepID=A0A317VF57_9EURO|nr:uncharacterized protein BO70DRAFT_373299 [Aspergillus heteromorphus CBS 117.55]PWY73006.1 hypothetical protein BO70DRAFT_373299 [Aspergillus heteromorphus CBS 117.55]
MHITSPSDIVIQEKLKESNHSVIFRVAMKGREYAMKVVNPFVCESKAYRRLRDTRLCERGVVPDFHRTIEKLDPTQYPQLSMFINDERPPSAIIKEYIPNMEPINVSNYAERRMIRLREILDDIHNANIVHGDPWPRNMMVCSRQNSRVLWIDLDSAQTFDERPFTSRQDGWIKEEDRVLDYFILALGSDHKEGKLARASSYNYS